MVDYFIFNAKVKRIDIRAMNIAPSSVDISVDEMQFKLSLLPVDSSNEILVNALFKHKNHDFKGVSYSLSSPVGQSKRSIRIMIEEMEKTDDFYYYLHLESEEDDDQSSAIPGIINAVWLDKSSGVVEITIHIFPDFRGKGVGGKSLDLLISRLSIHFNVFKYIVEIASCNTASIDLFNSRGFERCGIMSDHFLIAGERHNVELFERFSD